MAENDNGTPHARAKQERDSNAGDAPRASGLGVAGTVARFFIDSPLTPLLLAATLAIGLIGLLTTPRQEDPDISVPMIDVFVTYPGAEADQVARLAVEPLARLLGELDEVEHIYSRSRRGEGMVTVRFEVGEPMGASILKVDDKIRANLDVIPPGVTNWLVKPKTIDDVPIFAVTLWSRALNDAALRTLAFDLLQRLQAVENTGNGFIVGGRQREIRIEPRPEKLRGYAVTLDQLAETIRSANVEGRSGQVEQGDTHFEVSAGGYLTSAEDVRRLVIGNRSGRPVYVADVATVSDAPGRPRQALLYYSGAASELGASDPQGAVTAAGAVTLAIAKKPGSNGVTVAEALNERLEQLRGTTIPPSVQLEVTRNYGETANKKVNDLLGSLVGATAAVSLLTLIAVGLRPAVVVLAVIPVVILLTVWSAGMLGFTINRVSLFALIFSIGILVDDATVVVENIFRRWLKAKETSVATAVDAAREVGNPTIMATLTVLAALLPMGFVTGMMGPYMLPIPILGSVAMGFSLLAAFIFTPWLGYQLRPKLSSLERSERRERRTQALISRLYRPLIEPLIDSRAIAWTFLIAVIVVFGLSLGLFYFQSVTVKMLPYDDKREIDVVINLPEGTALPVTANAAHRMAETVRTLSELRSVQAHIGTAAPFDFNGMVRHYYLRDAPWHADLQLRLIDKGERERSSHAIAQDVRARLQPIARELGATIEVVEMPPGPPVRQTMVAVVYGKSPQIRRQLTEELTEMFERAEGVVDVDNSLTAPSARWHFEIDAEKASRYGVPVKRITRNLDMAMGDHQLGDIKQSHDREPVLLVLQLPFATRSQIHRLADLPINTDTGDGRGMIPLGELGRFVQEPQESVIQHKDLRPVEYVTAGMEGRLGAPIYGMLQVERMLDEASTADGSAPLRGTLTGPPDPGVDAGFEWAGEWTVTYKTFRDLGIAFAAALGLIYVLLVAEFRNFIHPAVIMAPIPLTLIGIVPGHWLLGAEFTATSMIGFIALAGIEVRNSILLVDFARAAVLRGQPVRDAVIEAGRTRLRPVVVTDLTMMAGAVAILFDPIFQGMAISLLFGPIIAVPLTLLVVPMGCLSTAAAFPTERGDAGAGEGEELSTG